MFWCEDETEVESESASAAKADTVELDTLEERLCAHTERERAMKLEAVADVDDVECILKLVVTEALTQPVDPDGVTLKQGEDIACETVVETESKPIGV